MSFISVTVIINGALEGEIDLSNDEVVARYVRKIEQEAKIHGYPTEVFTLFHDHDPSFECECIQFVQDHHPDYTFNQE